MFKSRKNLFIFLSILFFLIACQEETKRLPFLGQTRITENNDTIYHTIPDFRFIDQDSQIVTKKFFKDQVTLVDFFFTTCPTICPKMKVNMHTIYKHFEKNPHVGILSHSIDPEHDSVAVLRDYANALEVNSKKWKFVTGNRDSIYTIAEKFYMVAVQKDSTAPGGYIHGGYFVLIDPQGRIRGVYDGTDSTQTQKIIEGVNTLLDEYGWKQ